MSRTNTFARVIARRLVMTVAVVIGVTILTFLISRVVPGDPAQLIAGPRASPELIAELRAELGLDRPLWQQYASYMQHLAHGDLGQSIATSRPVLQELLTRVPATLELMLFAFVLSATAGLTLGVVTAVTRGRAPDVLLRVTAIVGISTPTFWLGLVLLLVFYNWLGWLPGSGRLDAVLDPPARVSGLFLVDSALAGDWLAWRSAFNHLLLPALTLALASTGSVMRLVRASMLEALGEDYIRTARAAGLPMRKVVLGHALRNALIPFITLLGLELASLLFGSVIVESVFSWPGVGRFVLESILRLDFPVIMGFAVLAAFAYVIANLVTDLLYMAVDPRIREVH